MTEQEFNNYFLNIATRLLDISHSEEKKRFSLMDDLANNLRNILDHDTYVMVVSHEQMGLRQFANLQTGQELHVCSFAILKKTEPEDLIAQDLAYTLCHEVVKKVIAGMWKDYSENHPIMMWLNTDNMPIDKVGPVADSHFGWEVNFQLLIKGGCNYKYDENDWQIA